MLSPVGKDWIRVRSSTFARAERRVVSERLWCGSMLSRMVVARRKASWGRTTMREARVWVESWAVGRSSIVMEPVSRSRRARRARMREDLPLERGL